MKKVTQLLLAGSLVFAGATAAKAQPPGPIIPKFQQPIPRTPETTIQEFVDWMSGLYIFQNDYVEGINKDNPEPVEIDKMLQQDIGQLALTAKNINISPDPQNADLVRANYILEFSDDALGIHLTQNDNIELKRHLTPNNDFGDGNEYWSIIPGNPQTYFESSPNDIPAPGGQGFTAHMATLAAYPQVMLPKIHLRQSEMQLKQLGLALMQFSQDYNERLDFTQQNFKEKLTPYLKNVSIFTAPGDLPGTSSYDVNLNILGLNLAAFTSPSDTVAFYLGHNQQLDFRYGGHAPVCFMDGHVEAITPDGAKNLRWKP